MAVRCADCTRRQHRNREASETRCAQTADASLSDFGTGDVSPSNGFHCNCNCNCNRNRDCNCNCNCNCNCRCAGLHATATVAARVLGGEMFLRNEERMPKRITSMSDCMTGAPSPLCRLARLTQFYFARRNAIPKLV